MLKSKNCQVTRKRSPEQRKNFQVTRKKSRFFRSVWVEHTTEVNLRWKTSDLFQKSSAFFWKNVAKLRNDRPIFWKRLQNWEIIALFFEKCHKIEKSSPFFWKKIAKLRNRSTHSRKVCPIIGNLTYYVRENGKC